MDKRNTLVVLDENGREVVCDLLFTFDWEENGKHYIVYTDHEKDAMGNTQVYASILEGGSGKLTAIESRREWEIIRIILDTLQEEIHMGEEDLDEEKITRKINHRLGGGTVRVEEFGFGSEDK